VPAPPLSVANRQRAVRLDLRWLRAFAEGILSTCLQKSDDGVFGLRNLEEIAIAIVSNRTMARLHVQFMNVAGATDVITFADGDIAISAETARDTAAEFGHGVEEELALYIVHGLLHLNGFDDTTPRAAARMRKVQERIWRAGRAQLPHPRSET
jgi:probable rRNA maturation factor